MNAKKRIVRKPDQPDSTGAETRNALIEAILKDLKGVEQLQQYQKTLLNTIRIAVQQLDDRTK